MTAPSMSLIMPMQEELARRITTEIRGHLSDAREKVLQIHRSEGWRSLGYESFKKWAQSEFETSWQQVYNLRSAAEIDENLTELAPSGETYLIPINHARQLRKLNTPQAQYRAYQLASEQAEAQGKDVPTAEIVESTVKAVQAEETVTDSEYHVVKQVVANNEMTATVGKQIVAELDKLDDELAQGYIQKLMAKHNLNNPDLVYPLGHKFKTQEKTGKRSKVLDEIERTGYLAGKPLSSATKKHLKRANNEAHNEHVSEGFEQKRLKMAEENQFIITVYKDSPEETLKSLHHVLGEEGLSDLFQLMLDKASASLQK